MCGNGIRCVVVMQHALGRIDPGTHSVLTPAGAKTVILHDDRRVTVDMGTPDVGGLETVDGVAGVRVEIGNPHFVLFDTPLDEVLTTGPRLEVHPAFPNKTNVEFVDVLGPDEVRMRVWERGVGETLACGSGACAVAAAAASLGKTKRAFAVHLPGGTLEIDWRPDGHVWMTGPAEEAFEGVWLQT
jgi:diaminopimelate epimerase